MTSISAIAIAGNSPTIADPAPAIDQAFDAAAQTPVLVTTTTGQVLSAADAHTVAQQAAVVSAVTAEMTAATVIIATANISHNADEMVAEADPNDDDAPGPVAGAGRSAAAPASSPVAHAAASSSHDGHVRSESIGSTGAGRAHAVAAADHAKPSAAAKPVNEQSQLRARLMRLMKLVQRTESKYLKEHFKVGMAEISSWSVRSLINVRQPPIAEKERSAPRSGLLSRSAHFLLRPVKSLLGLSKPPSRMTSTPADNGRTALLTMAAQIFTAANVAAGRGAGRVTPPSARG